MSALVCIAHDNTIRTTSRIVAKEFGKQHRDVLRAIRNLETPDDFNRRNFALIDFKDDKGRTFQEYSMTRDGFMFLAMGFTGAAAVSFKLKFIDAFNAMERQLASRTSGIEWKTARLQGKAARSVLTDTLADFISYAKSQGSKNADHYYSSITLMEYKALALIEKGAKVGPNFRDTLDGMQIAHLTVAENLARKTIAKGMDDGLHYKEIYQSAKLEVEKLAAIVGTVTLLN